MKKFLYLCIALIVLGGALTASGLSRGERATGETEAMEMRDLDAFKTVRLSAGSGVVEIVAGESYACALTGVEKDSYKVTLENGELTVELQDRVDFSLRSLLSLFGERPRARVTVPAGVKLSGIYASVASGEARLENVAAENIVLNATSGKVGLRNVMAYACTALCTSGKISLDGVRADTLTLSVTSGSVEAENIATLGMTASTVSGGMRIAGDMRGETTLSVTSGSANLTFAAPSTEYGFRLGATSGTVTINGERVQGAFQTGMKNSVNASVTSGAVHLLFSDD